MAVDDEQVPEWEIDGALLVVKDEEIARGASASVHAGFYLGQKVAVKIIDCKLMSQTKDLKWVTYIQEIKAWYKLDHPNITKFIGAAPYIQNLKTVHDEICPCIIAEYLSGGTLSTFLQRKRNHAINKLPFSEVVQFALDIARGLTYLHSKKIVHRDIKPDNMLLDKNRRIKIADFGVACIESEINDICGTEGYMAPEVIEEKLCDKKCDVYSFGICLWEIYCCKCPRTYMARHKLKKPKIPISCPRLLSKIIKTCLNDDPKKRPEMEEVVSMLEAADTKLPGSNKNNRTDARQPDELQSEMPAFFNLLILESVIVFLAQALQKQEIDELRGTIKLPNKSRKTFNNIPAGCRYFCLHSVPAVQNLNRAEKNYSSSFNGELPAPIIRMHHHKLMLSSTGVR
ncbi:hypothetical protein ACFE04_009914 [Oxalis oulophora]